MFPSCLCRGHEKSRFFRRSSLLSWLCYCSRQLSYPRPCSSCMQRSVTEGQRYRAIGRGLGDLPITRPIKRPVPRGRSRPQEEALSIPYSRYARQGQSDVLDCERLRDAEYERTREMCTCGLMFVATGDNVVLIEPRQNSGGLA